MRSEEGLSYSTGCEPFPVYSLAALTDGSAVADTGLPQPGRYIMLTVTGVKSPRCSVLVQRVLASREVVVAC